MREGLVLDGRYELSRQLGSGGFGIVWRARDRDGDRSVAVKLLRLGLLQDGVAAELLERFAREVAVLRALRHRNIVKAYGQGFHAGQPYLVMELVDGRSLESELRQRAEGGANVFEIDRVLKVGDEICDGLIAAHRVGITHRDLKPANIMITRSGGNVKIVDFGLVHVVASVRLTLPGTALGSLPYMAPEQFEAQSGIDGRTDLYSLGCVMFELATGRSPYTVDPPGGVARWWRAHTGQRPVLLRELRSDAPKQLEELLGELLAKNPDERPESARIVQQRLRTVWQITHPTVNWEALVDEDSTRRTESILNQQLDGDTPIVITETGEVRPASDGSRGLAITDTKGDYMLGAGRVGH